MKKIFLYTFLVLFIACEKPDLKPNFLFIVVDDLGYYDLGVMGSVFYETPNIDRIAVGGALMDAVYCTNSICGPSRASILSGNFSHVNGFYKNVDGGDFDGSQLTFPKIFQKNGYETAVIGKWHLGTTPTGFDYSKENNISTTLDKKYVIMTKSENDITEKILEILNK